MSQFIWLNDRELRALHDRLIMVHGGAEGIRDPGLLQSALARPLNLLAYEPETDTVGLAACLTAAIVRNHPFVDGNKRTGFVAGILFLELSGARFNADEAEAARMVIALASGAIDEAAYARFMRDCC